MKSIFVSHGAPTLVTGNAPAKRFLTGLGKETGMPRAILVASAHWETDTPRVTAAARPETIYDFYGFPKDLYELSYPAPGNPALAQELVETLQAAGFTATTDPARGLDHGAWAPLMLARPNADVPVLQLSLQTHLGTAYHLALGRALAPLVADGVLVVGSGGATHNLSAFRGQTVNATPPNWVSAFADWLAARIVARDWQALVDYRAQGPEAARNHPTEEHYLPLLVALGAALGSEGENASPRLLHRSYTHAVLAMDAYAFS
jgi:4,5-DOPA dioxygenase extradiol